MWGATDRSFRDLPGVVNFNPRTPCGVRHRPTLYLGRSSPFQSTHPVWGATCNDDGYTFTGEISIHAPRVGCDFIVHNICDGLNGFQSTHPVWGATWSKASKAGASSEFQSTRPVWGATWRAAPFRWEGRISIHAPRVGCDARSDGDYYQGSNFNPRTPCGVRRAGFLMVSVRVVFQSTHPVWGATY